MPAKSFPSRIYRVRRAPSALVCSTIVFPTGLGARVEHGREPTHDPPERGVVRGIPSAASHGGCCIKGVSVRAG